MRWSLHPAKLVTYRFRLVQIAEPDALMASSRWLRVSRRRNKTGALGSR